mmetsp:Transcript_17631/g.53982  ORF Transcript_17631/g.53982 Transcript_17631/m.53982 type:complete len:319 (+) Transcript_17631:355-1311(+)
MRRMQPSSSSASSWPLPESSTNLIIFFSSLCSISISTWSRAPLSSSVSSAPSPDASKPDLLKRSLMRMPRSRMSASNLSITLSTFTALAALSVSMQASMCAFSSSSALALRSASSCLSFAMARSCAFGPASFSSPSCSSSSVMEPLLSSSKCRKRSMMRICRLFMKSSSFFMTRDARCSILFAASPCIARVTASFTSCTSRSPLPSGSMNRMRFVSSCSEKSRSSRWAIVARSRRLARSSTSVTLASPWPFWLSSHWLNHASGVNSNTARSSSSRCTSLRPISVMAFVARARRALRNAASSSLESISPSDGSSPRLSM